MQQEMQSIAELNKHVREAVQGFKVIKAYNLEPVIKNEVDTVIESIKDRSNKVSALENAPVPIIDTLGGVAVGLTILYAGYRTIYGTYDPGTFMSFITAMLLAMDPARRVSQLELPSGRHWSAWAWCTTCSKTMLPRSRPPRDADPETPSPLCLARREAWALSWRMSPSPIHRGRRTCLTLSRST